jgi:glucose-6-phosphate 1-dehydrogenase
VRGQYHGYRGEPGVAPQSIVETYVAARLTIDNWRWADVPFLIRTGKSLPVTATEVHVRLKRPPVCVFDDCETPNAFTFRLSPSVSIALRALAKRPGTAMVGEPVRMVEHHHGSDEMKPYERLLGDAMRGDHSLFGDQAGVEASWRVIDGVLNEQSAPQIYNEHTWGPAEADALAADVGGWINPRAQH